MSIFEGDPILDPIDNLMIEPHADDVFLSMGGHIEQKFKNQKNSILTVFSGTRKRSNDAYLYASRTNCEWSGLGYDETQPYDLGVLDHGWIDTMLDMLVSSSKNVYLPLCITHPQHFEVREMFEKRYPDLKFKYYLDQPYSNKLKNSEIVTYAISNMRCISYLKPRSTKYRHIDCFKDQQKFFHFNNAESLSSSIEMIFEKL